MSRDAWDDFSKTILVRYVLSYLCGTLYLDPSVSLKRIFAFSVGGLFSLSTDALTCLRSSRLKLFQSWQVETANDLPPSVTQLNFGQIKFILLYLVTRLCCWLLSLKESSIYKGTSPLMCLYATQQSLNVYMNYNWKNESNYKWYFLVCRLKIEFNFLYELKQRSSDVTGRH